MSTFNPQIWVGQGNRYSEAPPKVWRTATAAISIPTSVYPKLLHNGTLHGLTSMAMPSIQASSMITTGFCKEFFSDNAPSPMTSEILTRLCYLTLPSLKIINILHSELRQAWSNGARSVRYTHLVPIDSGEATVTYFPLYVISYWKELTEMKNTHGHWQHSSDCVLKYLHSQKMPEIEPVAHHAWKYMAALLWNQSMKVLKNHNTVHTLYRILGDSWLSSSQMNDQLCLLAEEALDIGGRAVNIHYEDCQFSNILVDTYKAQKKKPYGHVWLEGVGQFIAEGKSLATIVHLGKVNGIPHWVALVVDQSTQKILYGDPLGNPVDPVLEGAVHWWLSEHIASELLIGSLPMTLQLDHHNCGILSVNGIRNLTAALPSLAKASSVGLALLQMSLFNNIAERVMTRVHTD